MARLDLMLGGLAIPVSHLTLVQAILAERKPVCSEGLQAFLIVALISATQTSVALLLRCLERHDFFMHCAMAALLSLQCFLCFLAGIREWSCVDNASENPVVMYVICSAFLAAIGMTTNIIQAVRFRIALEARFSRERYANAGWTESQTQLILLTLMASWYIAVGAFTFYHLETDPETGQKWKYENAVYFCLITLSTVGFGDMKLGNSVSQWILPFYATIGLMLFGMIIITIRQVILEFLTMYLSLHLFNYLNAYVTAHEETMFETTFQSPPQPTASKSVPVPRRKKPTAIELPDHSTFSPPSVTLTPPLGRRPSLMASAAMPQSFRRIATIHPVLRQRNHDHVLSHQRFRTNISRGDTIPTVTIMSSHPPIQEAPSVPVETWSFISPEESSDLAAATTTPLLEPVIPRLTFLNDQEIRNVEILSTLHKLLIKQVFFAFMIAIAYVSLFTLLMCLTEKWNVQKAVYFTFSVVTTIGYGDVVPVTFWGRNMLMALLLLGVGIITYFGSVLCELISNQWKIYVEDLEAENEE